MSLVANTLQEHRWLFNCFFARIVHDTMRLEYYQGQALRVLRILDSIPDTWIITINRAQKKGLRRYDYPRLCTKPHLFHDF